MNEKKFQNGKRLSKTLKFVRINRIVVGRNSTPWKVSITYQYGDLTISTLQENNGKRGAKCISWSLN